MDTTIKIFRWASVAALIAVTFSPTYIITVMMNPYGGGSYWGTVADMLPPMIDPYTSSWIAVTAKRATVAAILAAALAYSSRRTLLMRYLVPAAITLGSIWFITRLYPKLGPNVHILGFSFMAVLSLLLIVLLCLHVLAGLTRQTANKGEPSPRPYGSPAAGSPSGQA